MYMYIHIYIHIYIYVYIYIQRPVKMRQSKCFIQVKRRCLVFTGLKSYECYIEVKRALSVCYKRPNYMSKKT